MLFITNRNKDAIENKVPEIKYIKIPPTKYC